MTAAPSPPASGAAPPALDPLGNLALVRYLRHLTERFAIHNSIGIGAVEDTKQRQGPDRIEDLFVQPTCTPHLLRPEDMEAALKRGPSPAVPLLPLLVNERRVVLLADPGMGKSTLIQWLVVALAAPVPSTAAARFQRAIPIPLILRDLVPLLPPNIRHWDWDHIVRAFLEYRRDENADSVGSFFSHDNQATAHELFHSAQAWYLLDGLDEIGDPKKRGALRDAIWQGFDLHPQARFLITSRVVGYEEAKVHEKPVKLRDSIGVKLSIRRLAAKVHEKPVKLRDGISVGGPARGSVSVEPNHRLDEQEFTDALEDSGPPETALVKLAKLRARKAECVYLAPWDDQQQDDFARHWFHLRLGRVEGAARAREFVRAVREHPSTGAIGRVPNLLLLMALLYRYRADLPHGRARVYAAISHAYLENIDTVRKVAGTRYSFPQRERLLAIIAMHMQVRRSSVDETDNAQDADEEERQTEILVSQRDLEEWLGTEFAAGAETGAWAEMREFIDHIAKRSGLLLPRGIRDGQEHFAFAHLSFQEYYAACWLHYEFRRLLNLKAGAHDDLESAEPPESPPDARLAMDEARFAAFAEQEVWREPLLFLAEKLSDSSADTGTLRKWLFPIRRDSVLKLSAQQLLATISIDPQVNFTIAQRQQIWSHLWQAHFQNNRTWRGSLAPALLASGEFQNAVFYQLVETAHSKDVTSLNLRGCTAISDLQPLAQLTNLHQLFLIGCTAISDLQPLAQLTKLHQLFLRGCTAISDLQPLAQLTRLQILHLSGCTAISDLPPLAQLTDLQYLDLTGCTAISDLQPLAQLTNLQYLDLSGCTAIGDLQALEALTQLAELYLNGCVAISDLHPLAGLTSIRILNLNRCAAIRDLQPLGGLKNLKQINLSGCTAITDLQPLAKLKRLKIDR